jgi:hypothetical protein
MTSRAVLNVALSCAAFGGGALVAAPAAAEDLAFKYWGEISAHRASVNTSASLSRPGAPGTSIDMERDLGLKKHETLPDIELGARFFHRWFVTGEYFALDRNGTRITNRDIVFDAVTFPASATVDSKFRSDVYRVSVGYNVIQNPKATLGLALGLHATNFKMQLEGDVRVGAQGLTSETHAKKFLAPLPTVGVVGAYEVAPRVVLSGRADYLSLKIKDYDGRILNAQGALGYQITEHLEMGLAYRYVKYKLGVDKNSYTANIDYDFQGPAVYLRAGFR